MQKDFVESQKILRKYVMFAVVVHQYIYRVSDQSQTVAGGGGNP